ncbi:MAG TPA: class I SAM-dependent methyltransferase [Candidatus Paceibacterota bacterium]|nr:class I SAM-dependent methyltransferase [Verrucomicrobiota bacterium]HOX03837.1 class I SAM-dependent methyltransferase [Verrucomicrobiota bacterium]HRZ47220.1 class I SAM-dependent methyltransferase [Candidatus Paceibacterota bacterium]HRZ94028.1 class I SAM-dependent methyltransferase [Candidatus Paceibacterota bacterium]
MIIHRIIWQHLRHRDDPEFYRLQARDAIDWLDRHGVPARPGCRALDLGCGHGIFGRLLQEQGCDTVFADASDGRSPDLRPMPFLPIDLDRDDPARLGAFDLVICSNVLEHLAHPHRLLDAIPALLNPGAHCYLSWTNWLSPWGGHEFSPFHYLGSRRGHLLYDRIARRPRVHTPHENLFPTHIGSVLRRIRQNPALRVQRVVPRYYPELALLTRLPLIREFLTWNCAVLIQRPSGAPPLSGGPDRRNMDSGK